MKNTKDLSYLIKNNGLLWSFQGGSDSVINNFLHDTDNELTKQKYANIDLDSAFESLFENVSNKKSKNKNCKNIITDIIIYHPITQKFIKNLIEIDEVFRASTAWNKEPITVYRGAPRLNETALSGINSTTLSIDVAAEFYKGSLIKIDLPSNFPYIKLFELADNTFKAEKEIILPPCDFKIISKFTLPHIDYPEIFPNYYNCYELELTPKNLAECVLNRMKNPPKDYFKYFFKEQKIEFKKAQKLLNDYVNNYVKTNKFGFLPIDSQPQPN